VWTERHYEPFPKPFAYVRCFFVSPVIRLGSLAAVVASAREMINFETYLREVIWIGIARANDRLSSVQGDYFVLTVQKPLFVLPED
jgi:hypothetical protein